MKLSDLNGAGPLLQCLQWLDTLTRSAIVTWHPGQREAARHDLDKARELLDADLLTLAHRDAVLRRIDAVEADTQANPPQPPAPAGVGASDSQTEPRK